MAENQEDLREIALKRLKKRRDFRTHVVVYLLVNAFLWIIWAVTGVGFPWPIFVTAGWGIGLLMDARETYWDKPPTEQDVEAEIERLKRQQ